MTDAPMGELPEVTQRYFARGHLFESYVVAQLEARHGKTDVERQREIAWPLGVGHADAYIESERLIVEVVSTVAPHHSVVRHKIEQAKQYVHYDPDAESAIVYVINPSSLEGEHRIPVTVTQDDRDRIGARVAELLLGKKPDRVCLSRSSPEAYFCPFVDECFIDWTPPEMPGLAAELVDDAHELARLEARVKAARDALKAAESDRDELRDVLPASDFEWTDGTVRVKRSTGDGRVTYDVATAIEAGAVTDEQLEPFKRVGKPIIRWSVTATETPAGGGDVPDFNAPEFDAPPF